MEFYQQQFSLFSHHSHFKEVQTLNDITSENLFNVELCFFPSRSFVICLQYLVLNVGIVPRLLHFAMILLMKAASLTLIEDGVMLSAHLRLNLMTKKPFAKKSNKLVSKITNLNQIKFIRLVSSSALILLFNVCY